MSAPASKAWSPSVLPDSLLGWRPPARQLAPVNEENYPGARTVASRHPVSDDGGLAHDQIQQLIDRVFFPGAPKPLRQIVLAGFEEECASASICAHVVRTMAARLPGGVCAVDADWEGHELEAVLEGGSIRKNEMAEQRHENLWLVPSPCFLASGDGSIAVNVQSRMSALRRKFDYVVVHAPGGNSSLLPLLGQFADGVILVAQAHVTRRKAAVKLKERLQASNVRVVGVILAGRTFPIPEILYRWL